MNDLYRDLINDHSKNPRNHGVHGGLLKKSINNPLCGDTIDIYLDIKENVIQDISFEGQACAICVASASLMTEEVKGKGSYASGQNYIYLKDLLDSKMTIMPKGSVLLKLEDVKRDPGRKEVCC